MKTILKRLLGVVAVVGFFSAPGVQAATSVVFTSPPDGTVALEGTNVTPTGTASATGVIGQALDLILVLDSSGSMQLQETVGAVTQSRGAWQKQLAKDLVNSLSPAGTRVGVVEFDSNANLVRTLSPLTSELALVLAAIDSVDESGGTTIPSGQDEAFDEFVANGALADPDVLSAMVVFSDGESFGNPGSTADGHFLGGVDNISSVALPGASIPTMQDIADGVDGVLGNADDIGVFIDGTNLQDLIDAFAGGGAFVGIDQVDITLPDGTVLADIAIDAFGNFTVPQPYSIGLGPNTWTATAFGTDGTSDTANVTVIGFAQANGHSVPAPATLLLMAVGLLATGGLRKRS